VKEEEEDGGGTAAAPATRAATVAAVRHHRRPRRAQRYQVVMHNDDYTTMEFVIAVLMKHFHKPPAEAMHVMLQVHHKGAGVAGVYTRDVAETKVAEVTGEAREQGMPLLLTAEPLADDPEGGEDGEPTGGPGSPGGRRP
jgi:ATP-dependent Clp protease adaptor protein ClpS